ncbi:MAG: DNA polymerase III subunit gamma/tau [Zoogloeaceae bacterium]|jgi:DNA polymerase-3 subunit gamma/tau|nr:DNA polymerase III subunit gamma/tau [Zoogloeaceae bacterium]
MSYQVLARKWRPKSFATLVGQEHVVKALTHALEQQRLHHAYLFTGTRGVGKTTLARILAKALNCETGITATPCGTCSSCAEIDGGRFVDYIELDAASNRGVDDMTSLLEKATYAPTRGRFKVYVIDEVHQLSGHAFNAMLKTLEEPPEHVKFILATTDPQKIPVTVLSRCLQFNLKQMSPNYIVDHLGHVLTQENIPFEPAALRHLAKAAAGSMRDALSLLDQAIAHGAGKIEETGVRDMLGTVGDDYLFAVLDGLKDGNVQAMLDQADDMDERSLSFESALQELATLFHRIALLQFAPQALTDDAERARLTPYAAAFDAEFLQLCYQIAIHGRDEIGLAPDEHAGFAMTLLRLFAFRPEAGTPLAAGAGKAAGSPPPARPAAPPAPPAPRSVPASTPATMPAPADDWHTVAAQLAGMVRQLAQHCELIERKDGLVRLRLDPAHPHLQQHQDKLRAALAEFWGELRLEITLAAPDVTTPAAQVKQEKRERQEKAIAAIEQDPFVREAIDIFNASIDETTIKPV